MSAVNATDAASKSAAKKKKKSKKKANGKSDTKDSAGDPNGVSNPAGGEAEEEDDEEDGPEPSEKPSEDAPSSEMPVQNGTEPLNPPESQLANTQSTEDASSDTSSRLTAMQLERDNLRNEVAQLRQSLESLQSKREEELINTKEELEQTQQSKEHAETQYRNLLGKVNTIRSQLGDRLKADAAELEQARGRIEELEADHTKLLEENTRLQDSISELNTKVGDQAKEIDGLRNRSSLSTSNWAKERDDMISKEAFLREEYEVAKQAMQDWEILATEERSRRENLEEKVTDLEEQLATSREAHERVKGEAETQSNTVDGLQRALRNVQEERKRELREMVEQSQSQLDELRKQCKAAEETSTDLKKQLESAQKELERALPFEKEVKEKNLLIGKLRHEAVILNDHLTKALRFLKRGKPEDNVDRQLVTNHFLHFLALDRSDPKKFQVLQLIAALLGWTEEQKEQSGLVRQGSGSLKLPMSPFRRTPSTPSLTTDFYPESPSQGKESLAELWSEFLEREAASGGTSRRRGSIMSNVSRAGVMSPTLFSPTSPTGVPPVPPLPPMSPELKRSESPTSKSVK